MKSATLVFLSGVALMGFAQNPLEGKWVDLTHPFNEATVYWPTADGFKLDTVFAGETEKGYHYEAYNYAAAEHGGTHLDAPIHFAEGMRSVDQIPVGQLVGPAAVIDVSAKAAENRDYQVNVADFKQWEAEHGTLPKGAIVILNTGSSQYWPDRVKYMGTDERGAQAVPKLHFPGLHPDAAAWLVKEREIGAVGLDTPSIDYGQSTYFRSHQILFKANIPALENVADPGQLPPVGAWIVALPMKIENGSGGPARIVALLPGK